MIVKTKEELAALQTGGRHIARHLHELSRMVKPGATALELEMRARQLCEEDGDNAILLGYKYDKNRPAYHSALCVSVNDTIVHSPAADNGAVFEDGDIVSLDFVIKHGEYCLDSAVTVICGTPKNDEDTRLLEAAREALKIGISAAKTGNTTGDIGHAVESVAKKHKLGFPKNLSGHGIGKNVHELPHVPNFGNPGEGDELKEGQVITVEPMFALGSGDLFIDKDGHGYRTKDGSRTAHVEHTIIVRKDGGEILTKM
jgi:methionyl aminopeptidase